MDCELGKQDHVVGANKDHKLVEDFKSDTSICEMWPYVDVQYKVNETERNKKLDLIPNLTLQ